MAEGRWNVDLRLNRWTRAQGRLRHRYNRAPRSNPKMSSTSIIQIVFELT